ncbi:MAG TPA: glutaredoxin domain-containing protein [Candidatus Ozemobacteraceae bacterium]
MKPPIRIYTVTWCPHCIRFKAWLDESRIAYLDHDVDFDDAAWQEALILTGGVDMVPVAEIGGQSVWGPFNEAFKERVRRLLDRF